jgi:pyruvate dehydrogenase E1 component alpha subunit
VARHRLVERGVTADELAAIDTAAHAEIDAAMALAAAAPSPDPASAYTDVQNTGAGQWR